RTKVTFTVHWTLLVYYRRTYNNSFAHHGSPIPVQILIDVSLPFFHSLIYSYRASLNRSCLYNLPEYLQFLVLTSKVSSIRTHKEDKHKRGNNRVNSSLRPNRQLPLYADDSTFRLPHSNVRLPLPVPMLSPLSISIILSQITVS